MAKQIFKTDKKYWTQSQCDEIQVFFQFNTFFSKFYQHKDFDKIVSMTYYTRIHKNTPLLLENSKRPVAIILLSGQIQVQRKLYKDKSKKIKNKKNSLIKIQQKQDQEQFQFFSQLSNENSSAVIESQCKTIALNNQQAEILFVPFILYNQHINLLDHQKIQLIFKGLRKFFPDIEKKVLIKLAKEGCYYKQFRMNDFVYRAGSTPQQVYLLLQGNVKIQKPGFSAKKMFQMVILNPQSIFGEKDIKLAHRQQSAISCSAYARTLIIPKKQFLRFAKDHLPEIIFLNEEDANFSLPVLNSNRNSLYVFEDKKPKFKRFHSSNKIDSQKFIETKLIKNCHILVNLSPKGSRTSRLEGNKPTSQDFTKDQFKQKMKLFKRIRPNAKVIDFSNPIIDVTPKRNMSLKSQAYNNQD